MKFIIERVASWKNKPCKNAVLKERKKIDFAGNYDIWEIEVNTVEELMAIIEETGEPIILSRESYNYKDMPLIQIYDDYIE